jgi:glycosidase
MAVNTPKQYRNLVLYEVYVRNHGRNGSFSDVAADLPRLKDMGVDIVWFMPIHPIGQLNCKGSLGCPYSIRDYREVNPEYGTREEFRQLCHYAHTMGLKVMIDVVYNHTSHDATLLSQHPEWYRQDADGRPTTTVPEWSDVIDLSYDDPALWNYLIDTLKQWVETGVDGFRCDVASLVPLEFWQQARRAIADLKPEIIWLAESVHTGFLLHRRRQGLTGWSDGELHSAFDLSYDYDIWPAWEHAVADPEMVPLYIDMLEYQKGIYPAHTIKMRCVENHDQPRIMKRAPSRAQALAWTAFQAFNEGAFLIYAGQESENLHTPDLFEVDKVRWGNYSLQPFLTRLCQLKKHPIQQKGDFRLVTAEPAVCARWQAGTEGLLGIFNVAGTIDTMPAPLPDGQYTDLLGDAPVSVRQGELVIPDAAVILRYDGHIDSLAPARPSMIL